MQGLTKLAGAALLATSALTAPALAQSSSSPFTFSGPNSSSSSAAGFWLLPTAIALGFGVALDDYTMLDILTGERLYAPSSTYWDLILFWQLAAFSAATYAQFGFYHMGGDVNRVVQPPGNTFYTNGDLKEKGVFVGAGVEGNIDGSPVTPDDNKAKINGALSVGYGWQEFSAFGGAFTDDQDGLFLRAEVGLEIPLSTSTGNSLSFNPAIIHTQYDGDHIRGNNTVFALRIKAKF